MGAPPALVTAKNHLQGTHAQSQPVVIRPVIQVPPPTVVQVPENVFSEWVFPGLTLAFAVLAGIMSLVLWRIAKAALETANNELKLVAADLEFSKQQVAYLNRRANLTLSFDSGFEHENFVNPIQGDGKRWVDARLFLNNVGDRTARDATVILLVPPECRPDNWHGTPLSNPEEWYKQFGYRFIKNEEFEGGRRDRILFEASVPIYTGLPSQIQNLRLVVPDSGEWSSDIRWQIASDDGTTPPGGAFGILRFTVH